MSDTTKHTVELTELEMQLILETVEKTPYLGEHSDVVSSIRKKMKAPKKESK